MVLGVRMEPEIYAELKEMAKKEDITLSHCGRRAIGAYLRYLRNKHRKCSQGALLAQIKAIGED